MRLVPFVTDAIPRELREGVMRPALREAAACALRNIASTLLSFVHSGVLFVRK